MTKERIEIIRQTLIPFVKKELLKINYEGLGKSDAKEFENDLNEVLDLAIKALEQLSGIEDLLKQVCEQERWLSAAGYNAYNVDIAFKAIIKAIKNAHTNFTSEDCVSRQAVLDKAYAYGNGLEPEGYCVNVEDIQSLPPVTPTRKVGKWVRKPIRNDKGGCIGAEMICSCCNKDNRHDEYMNYCPNCGAKMRGAEND